MNQLRAALLTFGFAGSLTAATYYVDPAGDNADDGSSGSPWETVAYGLTQVAAGDTLKLNAGLYQEGTLHTSTAGSDGNRITIDGQGVATVQQLYVDHAYYTIEDTVFGTKTNAYSTMLWLEKGAHETIITNCMFSNATYNVYSIQMNKPTYSVDRFDTNCASYSIIEQNEFTGGGGGTCIPISLHGQHNTVRSNNFHDILRAEAVIKLYGSSHHIVANTFTDCLEDPAYSGHVDWIESSEVNGDWMYGATNMLFERNYVSNFLGQPVSIVDFGQYTNNYDWVFRNNILVRVRGTAQQNLRQVRWYNNTFYDCGWGLNQHAMNWGASTNAGGNNEYAHSGRSFNNAFYNSGGTGSTNVGWYSFLYSYYAVPTGLPLTNCLADYNFVSKQYGASENMAVDVSDVPIGDGYEWDNTEFWETNGINGGDPKFVDASGGDFQLLSASPLIDAGGDLSLFEESTWYTATNDFYGNPRDTNSPDIGAVEFQSSPPLGDTRYVATDGDDADDGSVTTPWRTIAHGVSNVTAGMTLEVASGTYDEYVSSEASGSDGSVILIQGDGAVTDGFEIDHDYITIRGFRFNGHRPTSATDADVVINAGADNVIIDQCEWYDGSYWHGSATSDSGTKTFSGDSAMTAFEVGQLLSVQIGEDGTLVGTNLGAQTVSSVSGNDLIVTGSLDDAGAQTLYISGHAGYMIYGAAGVDSLTVSDCLFSNLTYSAILFRGQNSSFEDNSFYAMQGWDHIQISGTNNTVSGNVHLNSPHICYQSTADVWTDDSLTAFENLTYSNNVISNVAARISYAHLANTNSGPQLWTRNVFIDVNEVNFAGDDVTVTNNTFVRVSKVADASYNQHYHAVRLQSGYEPSGITILNNIFLDCGLDGDATRGWYNLNGWTATTNYNYAAGAAPSYTTKTGFSESNGINGEDPIFFNVDNPIGADGLWWTSDDGLQPTGVSPLKESGNGNTTIGAYEYLESGLARPARAGSSTAVLRRR